MQKALWKLLMAGAMGLWLLPLLCLFLFPDGAMGALYIFAGLLVIHSSEILFAHSKLKGNGFSVGTISLNTLLFGFTWWVPASRGILSK